jgi:hypothetical protein
VALIHVAHLGLAAQGVQQMNAAEAEDGLLAEAVVGIAAIEVVGELAVPGIVALHVGVEQKDRNHVARDADDVKTPGAEGDLAALELEVDQAAGGGSVSGCQTTSDSVCWPVASRCCWK